MDVRLTWTDCDEAGDYDVPNVFSPRDLVSRPDNMDETVLHTYPNLYYLYSPRADFFLAISRTSSVLLLS